MLYDVMTDEWGYSTYVPTALGNVLLAVVILALLAAAVIFAHRQSGKGAGETAPGKDFGGGKKLSVKQLAFCAVSVALGTVLSNIKVFEFPTGGSVTLLSMLVIVLPGYWFGLGAGLMTGLAYGVLQLLIDPYVISPVQMVVDYFLGFGALGLSGIFSDAKYGLIKGYLAGVIGRYVFVVISGWIFFGEYAWEGWGTFSYSLAYNAIYVFSEAAITIIILAIPAVKDAFGRVKKMAVL